MHCLGTYLVRDAHRRVGFASLCIHCDIKITFSRSLRVAMGMHRILLLGAEQSLSRTSRIDAQPLVGRLRIIIAGRIPRAFPFRRATASGYQVEVTD